MPWVEGGRVLAVERLLRAMSDRVAVTPLSTARWHSLPEPGTSHSVRM
jgi:hypothetical protein